MPDQNEAIGFASWNCKWFPHMNCKARQKWMLTTCPKIKHGSDCAGCGCCLPDPPKQELTSTRAVCPPNLACFASDVGDDSSGKISESRLLLQRPFICQLSLRPSHATKISSLTQHIKMRLSCHMPVSINAKGLRRMSLNTSMCQPDGSLPRSQAGSSSITFHNDQQTQCNLQSITLQAAS